MARDQETSIHRGKRLRQLGDRQTELLEALASGDAERASRAREELERLNLLRGVGRRGMGRVR